MLENCNWSKIANFTDELCGIILSFLWTAMLAFCLAITIADTFGYPVYGRYGVLTWAIIWVVLRWIKHSTARHLALFAGMITANSAQTAFTFIVNGFFSCFLLGRGLSSGESIMHPSLMVSFGISWVIILFIVLVLAALKNHSNAQRAITTLANVSANLTDERSKCLSITRRCDDGSEKVFYWIQTNQPPADMEEEAEEEA